MKLSEHRATNLWEEYKYRHGHIWSLIFQLTLAVVALSITPYLGAAKASGILRFIPPFLSICLACFGGYRIWKEFDLFDPVKFEYLGEKESTFRSSTIMYIVILGLGSLGHFTLLVAAQLNEEFACSFLKICQ